MFLFVNVVFLFEWVYAIKVDKILRHKNNPYMIVILVFTTIRAKCIVLL